MTELDLLEDDDETPSSEPAPGPRRMKPPRADHKVVRLDGDGGEVGEILTAAELIEVRAWIALQRRQKSPLDLAQLADDQEHIHQIVEGKKASLWLWSTVGAAAKWIGIVIGAIVAWKAFYLGGGKAP